MENNKNVHSLQLFQMNRSLQNFMHVTSLCNHNYLETFRTLHNCHQQALLDCSELNYRLWSLKPLKFRKKKF